MKIAIDGPAGAGKSTIARLLAMKLGIVYIDTGAMYRALTWKALQEGISLQDEKALCALASRFHIKFETDSGVQRVFHNGLDITDWIRSPDVTAQVSTLASHGRVREVMVKEQQEMARDSSVVMDGRDIGEKVLPEADYKFFLTASIEQRTERRILDLQAKGYRRNFETVKQEIENRDHMDSVREVGALKVLPDSICIDTSELSIDEVLHKMLRIVREG